jgi:hypothetical protein
MGLVRLGISNPAATTNTALFTSDNQYLVSVIATNKSTTVPSNIRIWVQPSGSSSASQYAYIVYDISVDQSNSYETFRFAVNQNDVIYVYSSTANISFSAYGLVQYDIKLGAGISSYSATAPINPVDGMIWVDSDATIAGSSAKPAYVYSASVTSWLPFAAEQYVPYTSSPPGSSSNGDLWYDTVNNLLKIYNGSSWVVLNTNVVPYSSSAPTSPSTGSLWVDSSTMQLKTYDGASWVSLGAAPDDSSLVIAQRMFA